jgi:membrane protein implicated in regulation of membrane protease activity
MAILQALYQQDPMWLWLSLASLFVALNLASGSGVLMWPALAAAVVAALGLTGLRLGPMAEGGVFLGLSILMLAVAVAMAGAGRRPGGASRSRAQGPMRPPANLIGRIGRASGEFANGVGRVWIDGVEWAAELDAAGDTLPAGQPVRITRVVGGVRLQVHPLQAG